MGKYSFFLCFSFYREQKNATERDVLKNDNDVQKKRLIFPRFDECELNGSPNAMNIVSKAGADVESTAFCLHWPNACHRYVIGEKTFGAQTQPQSVKCSKKTTTARNCIGPY